MVTAVCWVTIYSEGVSGRGGVGGCGDFGEVMWVRALWEWYSGSPSRQGDIERAREGTRRLGTV